MLLNSIYSNKYNQIFVVEWYRSICLAKYSINITFLLKYLPCKKVTIILKHYTIVYIIIFFYFDSLSIL